MIAGLLLAVGCALAGSVWVLLKQRGAVAAPTILPRHPLRSAINLVSLQMVDGGVAGRRRCVAVARRRAVARVAVDRSGRDLRGLVFLAILAERAGGRRVGETGDGKHMRPRQRTTDAGRTFLTYDRVRDAEREKEDGS